MSNFDGLIFLTQLQQNSRLAAVRDGIDAVHAQLGQLQRHHAQAAEAQKRLEYFRQEIFTAANQIQSASERLDQTAGEACYLCFQFLLWASSERVTTQSFAEYQDKHIFDQALKRTHQILNHCARHYFTQDDLIRIERVVFMDSGMLSRHKEYLNWLRIKSISGQHQFLFSTMDTLTAATGAVLLPIPGIIAVVLMCKEWGYPRSILDWIVAVGIGLIVTPIGGGLLALLGMSLIKLLLYVPIRKRNEIVRQTIQPLATECGRTIAPEITIRAIDQVLSEIRTNLQNTWGNLLQVYDSLDETEHQHRALADEYADTKARLIDSPPGQVPPHIRDLEPLIPERRD